MTNISTPLSEIIYIYDGPGTSPVAIKHTEYTLKKILNPLRYNIQKIGPEEVLRGTWVKSAALFIMPGGADISYAKSLNAHGNQKIQSYVQEGGAYLGLCAGAYYGSERVAFAVGTPLEVVEDRELAFFPGVAEGPTLVPWDCSSNAGAEAALLQWREPQSPFSLNQTFTTYFNGGGHFVKAETYPHVTVLATYLTTSSPKAAIVEIGVGKGHVILTGVHCEFAPELFDMNDPFLVPIQKKLIPQDQDRQALMVHLLERLDIKTTSL